MFQMDMQFVVISYMAWIMFVFAVKHFFADFVLQNEYMLGKFKPYPGFILPLAAHSGMHALLTSVIVGCALVKVQAPIDAYWLVPIMAVYDFITHYLVDLIKAQYTRITKATAKDERFWVAIGIDQLAHFVFIMVPVIVTVVILLKI